MDLRKNFPFLRVTFTGERNFKRGGGRKGRPFRVPLGRFRPSGDRTSHALSLRLPLRKFSDSRLLQFTARRLPSVPRSPTTRALPASAPETYFFAAPPFSWRRGCVASHSFFFSSRNFSMFRATGNFSPFSRGLFLFLFSFLGSIS